MRVVDTSAWIEWLADSATGRRVGPFVPQQLDWFVPTIVQFELAKWVRRELAREQAAAVLAYSTKCIVVPLSADVAFIAAELLVAHRLSTADAIVYATAQAMGADLLTCDAHFRDLPGVVFLAKPDS
jgi:predicted nucleic acid-binding protein